MLVLMKTELLVLGTTISSSPAHKLDNHDHGSRRAGLHFAPDQRVPEGVPELSLMFSNAETSVGQMRLRQASLPYVTQASVRRESGLPGMMLSTIFPSSLPGGMWKPASHSIQPWTSDSGRHHASWAPEIL